jgi:hypothetical protein
VAGSWYGKMTRADEAGRLDHVLNRANFGAKMFRQGGDCVAFEKVLHETLRLDKIPYWASRLLRRVTSDIDPKCSNINNLPSIHAKRPDGCFGNFRQADDDSSRHRPIKMEGYHGTGLIIRYWTCPVFSPPLDLPLSTLKQTIGHRHQQWTVMPDGGALQQGTTARNNGINERVRRSRS